MASTDLRKLFQKNQARFATVEGNLVSASGGSDVRTVLVTSCRPKQGASVVSSCLAYALASEAGSRTVLIDACHGNPRLHAFFDLPDGPGFSDLMAQKTDLEKTLHETEFPGLVLLPHGSQPGLPLNASRCDELVQQLKALSPEFDYIVIDTDSLSTSSEVILLAPHVDGVLLVVESGRTRRGDVAEARAKIAQAGGSVLGAILNKASA